MIGIERNEERLIEYRPWPHSIRVVRLILNQVVGVQLSVWLLGMVYAGGDESVLRFLVVSTLKTPECERYMVA